MSPDLLSAIVQRLLSTTAVTSLLGAPTNVYYEVRQLATTWPLIRLNGYSEVLPGLTEEDEPAELSVVVEATTLGAARAVATAVKATLDTPAINPNATMTAPLAFEGGVVFGVMRNRSRPKRAKGLNLPSGGPLYRETIDYQFWISPNQ